MAIHGYATREGTGKYRGRMSAHCILDHFREAADLWCSSTGIGTYLGAPDTPTDDRVVEAVVRCVTTGINVIDTAINYRCRHAELSVGLALSDLFEDHGVRREEVIVCTKGGFVPYENPRRWFEEMYGNGAGGIGVEELAAGCHCMHPVYLADQLAQSRTHLGLETIDVYYIHNPETQLGHVSETEFYQRLEAAFEMLEEAVHDGKIRYYGLATWTALRLPSGNGKHISLERAKRLARVAAGKKPDHFKFIQLPLNLFMTEAVTSPTQPLGNRVLPAVPAALELGIHPVTSGSIGQGDIPPLTEEQAELFGSDLHSDCQRALQFTRSVPGVTTALVGMKQPDHVAETLQLGRVPPLPPETVETILEEILPQSS